MRLMGANAINTNGFINLIINLISCASKRQAERYHRSRPQEPERIYSTDFSELTGSMRSRTGLVISCTSSANTKVAAAAIR